MPAPKITSQTCEGEDKLSLDAKALAGAVWGSPIGAKTELPYRRPHAIWPRTREALTQLVQHGYLSETRTSEGVAFKAIQPCSKFRSFATKADLLLFAMSEQDLARATTP